MTTEATQRPFLKVQCVLDHTQPCKLQGYILLASDALFQQNLLLSFVLENVSREVGPIGTSELEAYAVPKFYEYIKTTLPNNYRTSSINDNDKTDEKLTIFLHFIDNHIAFESFYH